MDLKQYESALTAINKALELSDNSPYYIIKKGDLFFLLKDFQEAIKWYNIAEKKGSQHPTFFYNRAKAYIELGEKQKAINDLSIYLSKTPTKEGFLKRAAIYKSLNNPKGLIDDYNNAYSLDTSDINILVNKAQVLFVLKQYKLAEKTFKQIAKKKPSTSIINNIGLCAQKQNKFDEAIQFYSFAIEKEPSFSEAYYNRARTYAELKENILAIDDYSKAIAINSNYTVAYKYRAISLLINGKKTQACKDYKKALQLGLKTKDEQLNKLCVN